MKKIIMLLSLVIFAGSVYAQKYPERRLIRSGNANYEKGDYPASEVKYLKALLKDPNSYEAAFNHGNALYKQGRFEDAAQIYNKLATSDSVSRANVANSSYNTGNSYFQQRKLQQALEEYKHAIRANPDDVEAKFNYAYTKKLLEDQQDQDQDKDGDGENDQDKDQDNQDQDQDKQDNSQDQSDNNKDNGKQQDPQSSGMSRSQAEQMLDAVQAGEDKTRDKVEEQNAATVGAGSIKNW